MNRRSKGFVFLLVLLLGTLAPGPASAGAKTVTRCGEGFLEDVDGYKVLHVKGTPYAMGYQQGALLKDDIRELVRFLFDVKAKELKIELAGFKLKPDAKAMIAAIARLQRPHVPSRFFEELRGVADGSGMALDEIVVANFIPEGIRSELQPNR